MKKIKFQTDTLPVTVVPSLSMARSSLTANQFDLLLIDYDLDDGKGETLVRELREAGNKIRICGSFGS